MVVESFVEIEALAEEVPENDHRDDCQEAVNRAGFEHAVVACAFSLVDPLDAVVEDLGMTLVLHYKVHEVVAELRAAFVKALGNVVVVDHEDAGNQLGPLTSFSSPLDNR